MGRKPLSLTPEKAKKIINAIHAGVSPTIAAQAARVKPATLRLWLRRGRNLSLRDTPPQDTTEEVLLAFYHDYRAAEAECEANWATLMASQIIKSDNPSLIMQFLARRFPERWMHRSQVGMSQDATDSKTPVEVEFVLATPKKPIPAASFGDNEPEEAEGDDTRET